MFVSIIAFFAKPLVKKFIPFVLGAIALTIIVGFLASKWNGYKDGLIAQGRSAGISEMNDKYRKQVENNATLNRQLEARIKNGIDSFATQYDKDRNTRTKKEDAVRDVIEKKIISQPEIYTNPVCVTPPDMLIERNRIRALGPK